MKIRLLALVAVALVAIGLSAPAASATGRCEVKWYNGTPDLVC